MALLSLLRLMSYLESKIQRALVWLTSFASLRQLGYLSSDGRVSPSVDKQSRNTLPLLNGELLKRGHGVQIRSLLPRMFTFALIGEEIW